MKGLLNTLNTLSEAGILQTEGSNSTGKVHTEAPPRKMPSADDKRPPGDNRSAEQIVNDCPVLKNLGHQKDIKRDLLKKQCGDWENDPDSQKRADAAYRMSKVLEHIDSSKDYEGGDRTSKVKNGKGDGNIEGITSHGDARHGTEAGNLKDFAEKGYSALKADHRLDTTNDTHVKKDGSNKDNFQWFCGEAGKALSFVPIIGKTLQGIGDSEGGFLGALGGGLKGAAMGALDLLKGGKITPVQLLADMAIGGATKIATGGATDNPLEAVVGAGKKVIDKQDIGG